MRFSNRKAVLHLLGLGYDEIWLKPHVRRADLVYTRGEWYRALDLWNLFDGICFNPDGEAVYLQIKTNAWAKEQEIVDFMSDKKMLVMSWIMYSCVTQKTYLFSNFMIRERWDIC